MTNVYEMADDSRGDLIYARTNFSRRCGDDHAPHAIAPGATDDDYYLSRVTSQMRSRRNGRNHRVLDTRHHRRSRRAGCGGRAQAVYSTIALASTMIALAVLYVSQDALFPSAVCKWWSIPAR